MNISVVLAIIPYSRHQKETKATFQLQKYKEGLAGLIHSVTEVEKPCRIVPRLSVS